MESLTDKLSTLPLPVVVSILALLTAVRVSWKGDRSAVFRFLTEIIETIQIAVTLVFLIIRPFVALTFHIPTGSMQPTLDINDRIVVNRVTYRIKPIQYGDVVVFRAPVAADRQEQEFIKRVIGIAGDHIAIEPGSITVDDMVLTHTDIRTLLRKKGIIDASNAPLLFAKDGLWTGKRKIDIQEISDVLQTKTRPVITPGHVKRNGNVLTELYIREDPDYIDVNHVIPPGHIYVLGDNRNDSHDSHR
ncbi:MAG: signal peptidase I, partial [Armatimonadota bacterium]